MRQRMLEQDRLVARLEGVHGEERGRPTPREIKKRGCLARSRCQASRMTVGGLLMALFETQEVRHKQQEQEQVTGGKPVRISLRIRGSASRRGEVKTAQNDKEVSFDGASCVPATSIGADGKQGPKDERTALRDRVLARERPIGLGRGAA